MAIQWAQECCDRYIDPDSGSRVIQMTSSAAMSNNVYGEQPYTSPDGKRIAIVRYHDTFDTTSMFLVGDLDNLRVGLIERSLTSGVSNNAWSGYIYYWNSERDLKRISLMTLETETILHESNPDLPLSLGTISPDNRYMVYGGTRPGPMAFIERMDLHTGERKVIFEDPEIINPHLQFEPVYGKRILVQQNRGSKMDPDGTVTRRVGPEGTTLFQIDVDGNNFTQLAVGPPHTATCTGHECFVPGTDRVIFTTEWNRETHECDPRFPLGQIFTTGPGDAKPTCFICPEHRSNHISMSRCGTYFVADSYLGKTFDENNVLRSVALIIGNIKTGKYRILVKNTLASGGGSQLSHTHPYITADNRHVIYNTDNYYGVPQVYAATIPEEFLQSLA
jgi:hypothetical protein